MMATIFESRSAKRPFEIHNDEMDGEESLDGEERSIDESTEVMEDEDEQDQDDRYSEASDDTDDSVDPLVQEDIDKFQLSFKGIQDRYRLINRIGEGTFSTVYKAEDLQYHMYDNRWDIEEKENKWQSPPLKKRRLNAQPIISMEKFNQRRKPKFVAIKKIYVTSSPARIFNELELLKDLRGFDTVCPLITAFRSTDQVVAILPYFRHQDFREYFRNMTIEDIQIYFRSLFSALAAVHSKGIIHRDIKPTNFLYEPKQQRGVLVDFGLAEREGTDTKPCLCLEHSNERRRRVANSITAANGPSSGYPKNDSRPSRRANRAGTRGFRAPEVLFKCTSQTTSIDIWSAGVMLLTILSKRFPFFNSTDDIEATIEIATIFGVKRMRTCALLHGAIFETTIPTIGANGFNLEKIILWSTCRDEESRKGESQNKDSRNVENRNKESVAGKGELTSEEKAAVRFLERCFELDPGRRISAAEALEHEFLREEGDTEVEEGMDEEVDELAVL